MLPRPAMLLAPLLLAALGCATIDHTPKDFELDRAWPPIHVQGDVSIRPGRAEAGRFEIDLAGASMTIDRQEYTDSLAERIEAALQQQGATIERSASKSLELVVVYVNILPGAGRFHCVVDFTVRAGDGYVRGHQARANSMSLEKACNAALSEAAFACLGDSHLREYLASPVVTPASGSKG